MASMADIERTAKWLHEAYGEHARPSGRPFDEWHMLSEARRDDYRAVAQALLLRPPGWLRKAMSWS